MEKWVEIRRGGDFNKIAKEFGISPIVARVLRNRDLVDAEEINAFLSPRVDRFYSPFMLPGIDRVIFVLLNKISEKKKIRIIGDYDVDGISSTYIFFKGLKYFGADVDYVIPHRIEDGYGINNKLIKAAYDEGIDTILTCDNGIAAKDQTDYAKELGMTMVITDHHEVPYTEENGERKYILPNADALTDPKVNDSTYPFPGICGAFVAYKVIEAMAIDKGIEREDSFITLKEELTEFAALATVCDVMELKSENRSLVCEGAKLMEHTKNTGLKALIKVTKMEARALTPYHFGFVLGPCLNASGRLDTSLRALSLFLEEDFNEAIKKAEDLQNLNEERKSQTLKATEEAFKIIDAMNKPDKVLVVYLPDCHESLAGIVAGRVRERYDHPAFVVTKTEKGLKGSGRSIDAYDMFEGLNEVKEYLTKFGGHKLAAGISLEEKDLDAFRKALNDNCKLKDEDFFETVKIDMELPFEFATLSLARELEVLKPFGVGNEKPMFAVSSATIISGMKIGKNKNVGKYKVMDEAGKVYEVIYFGDLSELEKYVESIYDEDTAKLLHSGQRVKVVLGMCYQLEINSYMGNDSVQIQLKNYR
ncbi:MAG: single-stranded-DNA-specific exonuclease RecJ [Lachnospiraceae bacterium]|nr:single-stranded-DNA-specific exonuclease RecJ [Lachnospiraceae bacterium]